MSVPAVAGWVPSSRRMKRPPPEFFAQFKPVDTSVADSENYKAHVAKVNATNQRFMDAKNDPRSKVGKAIAMASTTVKSVNPREASDYILRKKEERIQMAQTHLMDKVKAGFRHSSEESMASKWAIWSPDIHLNGTAHAIASSINPDEEHVEGLDWLPPPRKWLDPRQQLVKTKVMESMLSENWAKMENNGPPGPMKAHHLGFFVPVRSDKRTGVREETMMMLDKAFKELDPDENGELVYGELKIILDRLGFNLSPVEFRDFCGEIDADKSGKIDYYEFKQAIPQFMRLRKKAQIKVKAEQMKELEAAKKQMMKPKRGVDSTERKFKASTPPQRRSLSSLGVVVSDEEKARWRFRPSTSMHVPRSLSRAGMTENATVRELMNREKRKDILEGAMHSLSPVAHNLKNDFPKMGRLPSRSIVVRDLKGQTFKF